MKKPWQTIWWHIAMLIISIALFGSGLFIAQTAITVGAVMTALAGLLAGMSLQLIVRD